ncbi:MAG: tetratricopeptide repeat protein [Gammaproteobacteria bacterium]|nr:tetratricopeptide repeat protein [Gammaproteobacteria bacterium]
MTEYMTEQEQIEQLKNWVKQYGLTIIAGVLMAVIIISSWHAWQRYQTNILLHASSTYDEMLTLKAQNDSKGAMVQADKLLTHYPRTPYAQMAAFLIARDAIANKQYAEATKQLTWVLDHSHNRPVIAIANLRIARIELALKKPEDAIKTLNKVKDKSFKGMADEVKGDAYLSMNSIDKAKEAYKQAIQELPTEEATRKPILQMKIDNLATVSDITL